jgi:hypothetical protein
MVVSSLATPSLRGPRELAFCSFTEVDMSSEVKPSKPVAHGHPVGHTVAPVKPAAHAAAHPAAHGKPGNDGHKHPTEAELLASATPIDISEEEAEEVVIVEEVIETEQDKIDHINEGEKQHEKTQADANAIDLVDTVPEGPSRIKRSDYGAQHKQTVWNRQPNKDGQGSTHVKTFVTKLRMDAIENMDAQINEWLDAHPEVEVKFSTSSIGVLVGKINEPALFVMVWV